MPSQRRLQRREPQPDPDGNAITLSEDDARPILESGEIVGGHRMPWGSNYTFLVRIDAGNGRYLRAIYKPRDGERPLHDFPSGSLYKREYATFVLSRALGWPAIPLTLIRDGPYGIGSVQQYIDCDPNIVYFNLIDDWAEDLERLAVFDLVVNNADRKAGHCLLDGDGRVWSIDHGLTFHPVPKLRTVMLEFWGKPVARPLVEDLEGLKAQLDSGDGCTGSLRELLEEREILALRKRVGAIVEEPVLPHLDPYRNVPWPWV